MAGQPFRRSSSPGCQSRRETVCDCLAANPPIDARRNSCLPRPIMAEVRDRHAPASKNFYSGHTPRLQNLNYVCDQTYAPSTTSDSRALPALVILFIVRVTWLASFISRAAGHMSGLPSRHSLDGKGRQPMRANARLLTVASVGRFTS